MHNMVYTLANNDAALVALNLRKPTVASVRKWQRLIPAAKRQALLAFIIQRREERHRVPDGANRSQRNRWRR
jgi:hypothetical protein